MSDVTRFKGAELPSTTVVVERSAVSHFATAVTDSNPVFHDGRAATAAGLDAIPATPTFSFVMSSWGAFPEIQQDRSGDNPFNTALAELMGTGGLLLHGGQEFSYERPVQVGDRLTSRAVMSDIYTKVNKAGRTMTFLETETIWADADDHDVVTMKMTLIHMG